MRHSIIARCNIGFIGLGEMGSRMVNCFLECSMHSLFVHDIHEAAMERAHACAAAKKRTLVKCRGPADVAAHCADIITMLPNADAVRAVLLDDTTGVLSQLQPQSLVVDCSTVDPQTSARASLILKEKQGHFSDAPVSGGINAAASGSLVFMIGAEDGLVGRVKALLRPLAKSLIYTGPVTSGTVCKLCNNLVLGQHMLAVSEAMLMGTRLGVDPSILASVMSNSTARCWSVDTYNPFPGINPNAPGSKSYNGGFGSALMLKDLTLARKAADSVNLSVEGCSTAHRMYDLLTKDETWGRKDFSAIMPFIDNHSPNEIVKK